MEKIYKIKYYKKQETKLLYESIISAICCFIICYKLCTTTVSSSIWFGLFIFCTLTICLFFRWIKTKQERMNAEKLRAKLTIPPHYQHPPNKQQPIQEQYLTPAETMALLEKNDPLYLYGRKK